MARCRILVLYGRSLMLKGLRRWLSEQWSVEVGSVDIHDLDVAVRISRFSPDVIIVDEDDIAINGSLTVPGLVRDYPEAKILKVDPGSNTISIFRQQKVTVAEVDDLLRLVTTV